MKFTLTIKSNNDDNGPEMVSAELVRVSELVLDAVASGMLRDVNGNHVGDWEMTDHDD